MNIPTIKRPWQKPHRQGTRYNPDPFYHTTTWKRTRTAFRMGFTEWNGTRVPNTCCIDCFKETGRFVEGKNTDHKTARKAGGADYDHDNLQTQCDTHHARKSANENKKQPGK